MVTYIKVQSWIRSRTDLDRGASLVEYALLLAMIAVVCVAALTSLGDTTSTSFSHATARLG